MNQLEAFDLGYANIFGNLDTIDRDGMPHFDNIIRLGIGAVSFNLSYREMLELNSDRMITTIVGYDGLDYLVFCLVGLPDGSVGAFRQHVNAPALILDLVLPNSSFSNARSAISLFRLGSKMIWQNMDLK
jgi:hypothetical protein